MRSNFSGIITPKAITGHLAKHYKICGISPVEDSQHIRFLFAYNLAMDGADINWLFVDLNSYFASIEQELAPELRGRPIVIAPVNADSTCCIAASYQAKAYGIKAGTGVHEAKVLCPHVIIVQARPRLYVEFHHKIIGAIERCAPIQQVMSCDEFACELMRRERGLLRALEISYAIKQEISRHCRKYTPLFYRPRFESTVGGGCRGDAEAGRLDGATTPEPAANPLQLGPFRPARHRSPDRETYSIRRDRDDA
ncbi:hypothetical protein [Granulicella sp. L46]|uniref:Y-family DNA polymerase n=1 Tax=Granulicella sp. L46 TaxID=1641865 RepID=UPI00131CB7BE|nr:hypothetical protein [Granulicella sp. L46]